MDTTTQEQIFQELRRISHEIGEIRRLYIEQQQLPPYYGPIGPSGDREACTAHQCEFYLGYLAYGPADLSHEGYHSACLKFRQHTDSCNHDWGTGGCPTCLRWEERVRA